MKHRIFFLATLLLPILLFSCSLENSIDVKCRSIDFISDRQLLETEITIPEHLSKVSVSPDNTLIAYSSTDPLAFSLIDREIDPQKPLFKVATNSFIEKIIWSKTGENVAVLTISEVLQIVETKSNTLRVFQSQHGPIKHFAWDDQGELFLIAYTSKQPSVPMFEIISVDSFKTIASFMRPENFTMGISHLAWSGKESNGQVVFFSGNRLFSFDMSKEELTEIQITNVLESGNNDVEFLKENKFLIVSNELETVHFYKLENKHLSTLCKFNKKTTGINFDSGKLAMTNQAYIFGIRSEAIYLLDLQKVQIISLKVINFEKQFSAGIFDINENADTLIIADRKNKTITIYYLSNEKNN